MITRRENRGGTTVLSLQEDRLDANNSEELKNELRTIFEEGDIHLVVDLKRVQFIDSSGLGVLVSGYKNASLRRGSLKLAELQGQVKSMFELTRLHRVFDIYGSVEEALQQ